jgi:hypothetical protein
MKQERLWDCNRHQRSAQYRGDGGSTPTQMVTANQIVICNHKSLSGNALPLPDKKISRALVGYSEIAHSQAGKDARHRNETTE